jgi:hypothetical protein
MWNIANVTTRYNFLEHSNNKRVNFICQILMNAMNSPK